MKMPTSEGVITRFYNNRSALDLNSTTQENTSFYEHSGSGSPDYNYRSARAISPRQKHVTSCC